MSETNTQFAEMRNRFLYESIDQIAHRQQEHIVVADILRHTSHNKGELTDKAIKQISNRVVSPLIKSIEYAHDRDVNINISFVHSVSAWTKGKTPYPIKNPELQDIGGVIHAKLGEEDYVPVSDLHIRTKYMVDKIREMLPQKYFKNLTIGKTTHNALFNNADVKSDFKASLDKAWEKLKEKAPYNTWDTKYNPLWNALRSYDENDEQIAYLAQIARETGTEFPRHAAHRIHTAVTSDNYGILQINEEQPKVNTIDLIIVGGHGENMDNVAALYFPDALDCMGKTEITAHCEALEYKKTGNVISANIRDNTKTLE